MSQSMTTYDLVQQSQEVLETAKRINSELTQQYSTQRRGALFMREKDSDRLEVCCYTIWTSENVTLCEVTAHSEGLTFRASVCHN